MKILQEKIYQIEERRAQQTKIALAIEAFFNMLPVSITEKLAYFFNPFIDSLITAIFLGMATQAALGFFVPVITVISLVWVVIMGVQTLCASYRGKGDEQHLRALFYSAMVFLGAAAVIISAAMFFGRAELAALLGAEGQTALLLQDYIAGYSLSIFGQALYPLLLWFLNFNGDEKTSKFSVYLMIVSNVFFDLLFVLQFGMGAFGLGLATSFSYLLTFAYVFAKFLKNFGWQNVLADFRWRDLLIESMKIGKPSLTFNLGITLKAYVLNMTLLLTLGDAAIAVMNILGTFCGMLGAIPSGHADVFGSLGAMSYGAKDRNSFLKSNFYALKSCIIFSSLAMLGLMIFSVPISSIYFAANSEAWIISQRMLLLFPSFLVLNGICGILLRAYQVKEEYRTHRKDAWLVDGMPLFENLLMALLAVMLVPIIGSDAVWLSFPVAELICLGLIAATVFKEAGKVTFKLADWLKLGNFGLTPRFERDFHSWNDAECISNEVITFCGTNHIHYKSSILAGITVEELLANVVIHGSVAKNPYAAYISVTLEDTLTIRVYDNNREFNPRKTMRNIRLHRNPKAGKSGLRLIKQITDSYGTSFNYENTGGINVSTIKLNLNGCKNSSDSK